MSPETSTGPAPPVTAVEHVVAADAVLRTADELGLLAAVSAGPVTAAAAAQHHDTDAVAVLLDGLVALGLVEHDEAGYRAHPDLPALVARMRTGMATLPERVRSGRPRLAGDDPREAGELYGGLAAPLGAIFADVAEEVADLLAAPALRILDVGAGAAPWTRAIARRDPSTRVVAVDLPPVVPATRAAVRDDRLDAQFEVVTADVLRDPLPATDVDLVVAANLCHLFDGTTAAHLVSRLVAAARPGGAIAIIDALPDHPDPDRRRSVALYAAGLLTRTATGGVHPFDAYASWLTAAGATRVRRHDCTSFPTSLVTARAT